MPRDLNPFEKDELLRFFLYRMSSEQRQELMSTYPRHYARIYPEVKTEIISSTVESKLKWMKDNERNPVPRGNPVL